MTHWYVWYESRHNVEMRDTTHLYVWAIDAWHDTYICEPCVTRLIYMRGGDAYIFVAWIISKRCYAWHDIFICEEVGAVVELLFWENLSHVWHDAFTCAAWLIYMCGMTRSHCGMTYSYVWHDLCTLWQDSFICVAWLIHMCGMTHSYVWHDSFTLWHDLFIRVVWLIHIVACVIYCSGPCTCVI